MGDAFDGYSRLLGIHSSEQPVNRYRLLGLEPMEGDLEIIGTAADQLISRIKALRTAEYAEHADRLMTEVQAAKARLLDPTEKATYDQQLREHLSPRDRLEDRPLPAIPPPPPSVEGHYVSIEDTRTRP